MEEEVLPNNYKFMCRIYKDYPRYHSIGKYYIHFNFLRYTIMIGRFNFHPIVKWIRKFEYRPNWRNEQYGSTKV